MARDPLLGTSVRRYSPRAAVYTDVQPTYQVSRGSEATFDAMRQGFEKAIDFMRPAVTQEMTAKGEQQALAAIDSNSFEMRRPFSIRDQAFNATGERVITNRALIQLDEGLRNAVRDANGSMTSFENLAAKALADVRGQIPNIPGLDTTLLETYDRSYAAGRRQTTDLAERQAAARVTQAASDAAAAVSLEVSRLALTSGTVDELSAALTQGQDILAAYGPREAFTLNGKDYPADPSRSGVYSARQLDSAMQGIAADAHELFLRADFQRSDAPSQWAQEFSNQVLSGNSPLPPDKSLDLLSTFESQARTRENARQSEEAALERDLNAQIDAGFNPFVTAADAGVVAAITDQQRSDLRAIADGHPALMAKVEDNLAAADEIVKLQGMSPAERVSYFNNLAAQFASTDGISQHEATVINAMSPYIDAARRAITEETIGVSAADQMLARGAIPTDAQIAEWKTGAGDNATILRSIAVVEDARAMITSGQALTGDQRQQWIDQLQGEATSLEAEGGNVGAAAQRRLDAIDAVNTYFDSMTSLASNDAVAFANRMGVELPPLAVDANATLGDVAGVITERVSALSDLTAKYGNPNPVPLSSHEVSLISQWFDGANRADRVAFVAQIDQLPADQSNAIFDALGNDVAGIHEAARVRDTNPAAMRVILSGVGANVTGTQGTNVAEAEIPLQPFIMQDTFPPNELDRIRSTALLYAKGRTIQNGGTEVSINDLERGYDIALGADINGDGGIETVGNFGSAILPTGMKGRDLNNAIRGWDDAALATVAGGDVVDIAGRTLSADALRRTIGGFRYVEGPNGGMLAPLDYANNMFLVKNGDTLVPFMFSPREVVK